MSHSKIRVERHLALAVGVAAASAWSASAAVVQRDINLVVPATTTGLYVNVETGATGPSAGSTLGWDINPYGTSSLSFQLPLTLEVSAMMRAPGATSGSAGRLVDGDVVGPSGSFTTSLTPVAFGSAAGQWRLNSDNFFGFKFQPASGGVHYGYGLMRVGATAAVRTLVYVRYESVAGVAITVPAPGAIAMLGLAGLATRRRRR